MGQICLFNSMGDWVGTRQGDHLFTPQNRWIGWFPLGGPDASASQGGYLGTIYDGNRFYYFQIRSYGYFPNYYGLEPSPAYASHPGFAGYALLPFGARDVNLAGQGIGY